MTKGQWDEESFFEKLRRESGEVAFRAARHLLELCVKQGYQIGYGNGKKEGTLFPYIHHQAQDRVCKLFEMFTHDNRNHKPGYVLLASYLWANEEWPESPFREDEKRQQLIAQLNRLPLKAPLPKDAHNNRPRLALDWLDEEKTLKTFMEVHEWVANQIRASNKAAPPP